MGRMRSPSLSLHGIEGAFSGVGAKTVIPAKVSGKFSIRWVSPAFFSFVEAHAQPHLRLVPPQTPENVEPLVTSYIESEFAKLNSKSTLTIENLHGGKPWVTDHTHWNFEAAKRATKVRFFLCSYAA